MILRCVSSYLAQCAASVLLLKQIHSGVRYLTTKPRSQGAQVHLGKHQLSHATKHRSCITDFQGLFNQEVGRQTMNSIQ